MTSMGLLSLEGNYVSNFLSKVVLNRLIPTHFLSFKWSVFIVAVIAIGYKAFLLVSDVVPFNSDEAIVALMAKHILEGDRPIFFYGQAYMGSLDAWLVALGFKLF